MILDTWIVFGRNYCEHHTGVRRCVSLTMHSETEAKLSAIQQSMSTLREQQPDIAIHIASEASAREELAAVTEELSRYRSLLGEASSSDLARQLKLKEDELKKFRLLAEQHQQAEDAIYSEVERLSGAWEALDEQLKSKIFSLNAAEERVAKSAHEVGTSFFFFKPSLSVVYRKPRRIINTSRQCVTGSPSTLSVRMPFGTLKSKPRSLNA